MTELKYVDCPRCTIRIEKPMGACFLCSSTRIVTPALAAAYVLCVDDSFLTNSKIILIHKLRCDVEGLTMSLSEFQEHGYRTDSDTAHDARLYRLRFLRKNSSNG